MTFFDPEDCYEEILGKAIPHLSYASSALVKTFYYSNQLALSFSKVCPLCSSSDEFLISLARKFDCSEGMIPKSFDQMLRPAQEGHLDLVVQKWESHQEEESQHDVLIIALGLVYLL